MGVAQNSFRMGIRPKLFISINMHQSRKPGPRPVDTAFDCAHCHVTNFGSFFIGKARCPDQDDGFALVFGQLGEGAAQIGHAR